MLNRRILRIKAFKVLYSSKLAGNVSLQEAESRLDVSCEAVRDLYIFMLGIVQPLTAVAREKIESARNKFNPTEEEMNPNMKFAENALAKLLAEDTDFMKAMAKRKFSWDQYDVYLRKLYAGIREKDYFKKYMESPERSLKADCRLFVKIFEEEFVSDETLERILEDMSIWWNDDLAYSLTAACHTLDDLAKGQPWRLPPLYRSEMCRDKAYDSDKLFVHKLLQSAFGAYERYLEMLSSMTPNWDADRTLPTDIALIVMGLAEAEAFPSMPLKVTINEYVEISKYYGTPKSRQFVNGLLDRMVRKLQEEGKIVKTGAALA